MENAQRKREILDVCLATFIRRGLYETSVRDLSRALALQSGGIYYWFKDKDDVVVTCAEEAALRLEEHLIAPALQDIREPDRMMERLRLRSDELRPMMKFFASVCACSRYEERLRPVLGRLAERYEKYAARFASELHCELQEIAPYVYFAITTVTDYMIFGEVSYIEPQIRLIKSTIRSILEKDDKTVCDGASASQPDQRQRAAAADRGYRGAAYRSGVLLHRAAGLHRGAGV